MEIELFHDDGYRSCPTILYSEDSVGVSYRTCKDLVKVLSGSDVKVKNFHRGILGTYLIWMHDKSG